MTCWTHINYLSFRLRELNFEVRTYDNYRQEEVLDKISEGMHMHDHINGTEMTQTYSEGSATMASLCFSCPSQCTRKWNTSSLWSPAALASHLSGASLTNLLPQQPQKQTIQMWTALCSCSWAMARMITFTPSMARSAFKISRPCSKETNARALWESPRSLFCRYMWTNTWLNRWEYGLAACFSCSAKTCLCPPLGMPRRQAWWPSDCLRCCGQRDKRGDGGRQRCAHPSCWGWFHHVLLCGWGWVGFEDASPAYVSCGKTRFLGQTL